MIVVNVETYGGLKLRASMAGVTVSPGAETLRAEWDMRHGLIHNPRYLYTVKGKDVKTMTFSESSQPA